MHKLLLGRDPLAGAGLVSQPTLSRFENGVRARELLGMSTALAACVPGDSRRRRRWQDLSDELELKVEATTYRALHPRLRNRVLQDEIRIL